MEVTLLFTTVLSVFMIVLAVRVLDLRGSPVTKSFHKPDRQIDPNDLERAIRGHGNLIEYAPLFLILMLALALGDVSVTLLYASGIIFFSLVPRNKNNSIIDALITMKRLAFVKDKSIPAIFISGPIL